MAPLYSGVACNGVIEYSAHKCPSSIKREVESVFPGIDVSKMLIVPTCQHSAMDLVKTGDEVEVEKDLLLERFMAWAKQVCSQLSNQGHWADFIDPCSGLPMVHQVGNVVYAEVEALTVLMGYKTSNAGCCKVLLHPTWGSAVYPASMFTTAPEDVLQSAIQAVEAQERKAAADSTK